MVVYESGNQFRLAAIPPTSVVVNKVLYILQPDRGFASVNMVSGQCTEHRSVDFVHCHIVKQHGAMLKDANGRIFWFCSKNTSRKLCFAELTFYEDSSSYLLSQDVTLKIAETGMSTFEYNNTCVYVKSWNPQSQSHVVVFVGVLGISERPTSRIIQFPVGCKMDDTDNSKFFHAYGRLYGINTNSLYICSVALHGRGGDDHFMEYLNPGKSFQQYEQQKIAVDDTVLYVVYSNASPSEGEIFSTKPVLICKIDLNSFEYTFITLKWHQGVHEPNVNCTIHVDNKVIYLIGQCSTANCRDCHVFEFEQQSTKSIPNRKRHLSLESSKSESDSSFLGCAACESGNRICNTCKDGQIYCDSCLLAFHHHDQYTKVVRPLDVKTELQSFAQSRATQDQMITALYHIWEEVKRKLMEYTELQTKSQLMENDLALMSNLTFITENDFQAKKTSLEELNTARIQKYGELANIFAKLTPPPSHP